jgi:hypothetical protein
MIVFWLIIIFVIAFILAVKSAKEEFRPPSEVVKLKITKKKAISGVILFLKQL